jgi:ribosomal protein S18 acetylase RimI-like enzyme
MIRPMRTDEFPAFLERAHRIYIGDMVEAGLDLETARAKSERDHAALLPQGVQSPKQHLYVVDDGGEPAGFLWVAERDGDMGRQLFVYGVEIDEGHRGRGLGRAAMEFAEEEARRLGYGKVALNVFGGNGIARGMYRSLGYSEVAIHMEKKL